MIVNTVVEMSISEDQLDVDLNGVKESRSHLEENSSG